MKIALPLLRGKASCVTTTQAQRPEARDAPIATAMLTPGSLRRMVRPDVHLFRTNFPVSLSHSIVGDRMA